MILSPETDHGHEEPTCWLPGRGERKWDRWEVCVWLKQTVTFGMYKQWGTTIYSPGNYAQFLRLEHDKRQYQEKKKKEGTYMFSWVTFLYSKN